MKAAVEERSRQPRRSSGTDSPTDASAGFLLPSPGLCRAAGIIEGEGCVTGDEAHLDVRVNMTDVDVLLNLQMQTGVGNVTGPYEPRNGGTKQFWVWSVYGACADDFLEVIYPMLGERRKGQVDIARTRWHGRKKSPSGVRNPVSPVYVSGPMTGYEDHNYPAFRAMAKLLRDNGFVVVSPHELSAPDDYDEWHQFLRRDLIELASCNSVMMLPGWVHSEGARLEHLVAKRLGMAVNYPQHMETLRARWT